jgi:hypothetical protein
MRLLQLTSSKHTTPYGSYSTIFLIGSRTTNILLDLYIMLLLLLLLKRRKISCPGAAVNHGNRSTVYTYTTELRMDSRYLLSWDCLSQFVFWFMDWTSGEILISCLWQDKWIFLKDCLFISYRASCSSAKASCYEPVFRFFSVRSIVLERHHKTI